MNSPFEPTERRRELARFVGQIQTLTLELHDLQQREVETPEINTKEGRLERLRRQLAAIATRAATDELGNAA